MSFRGDTADRAPRRYGRARTVAAMLDVSVATVRRWAASGRLPAPHHLGDGTTLWDLDAVARMVDAEGGAS